MTAYFIFRYRPQAQPLPGAILLPALAIGLAAAAFLCLYIPVVKGRKVRENAGSKVGT
jgi:multisubunit Na+/H+ antiporter MnhC subunit